MYPSLIVEGEEYFDLGLHYRKGKLVSIAVWTEDNELKTFYNKSVENNSYVEKQMLIDFNSSLKWHKRYDEIHEAIGNNSIEKDKTLIGLAIDSMHNELPFTPNENKKEYFDLLARQIGILEAQEIIEGFMEEDVEFE